MARQHVSNADVTDAVINCVMAGDGTTAIVAAPTDGRAIRVLDYVFTVSAATVVTWKSGVTAKSGPMSITTGISSPGDTASRAFQCAPNQALNLGSTGTVTIGGYLTYQLVEPT